MEGRQTAAICGTVFKITTSGRERVLFSFGGGKKVFLPSRGLLNVNGTLYGMTDEGGVSTTTEPFSPSRHPERKTCSTVSKAARETAEYPSLAGLINVKGTLYGTTLYGGGCTTGFGGTVFSVTTSGEETVVHSFEGGPGDGLNPLAGLINVNGTLYGTTAIRGRERASGTVFAVTPSGKETVLHSFNRRLGRRLIPGCGPHQRQRHALRHDHLRWRLRRASCGTVFSITPSGTETVLHSFKAARRDGA